MRDARSPSRPENVGAEVGRATSIALRMRGPVPGTVKIGPEHEVDTSAAVPGTDMYWGAPWGEDRDETLKTSDKRQDPLRHGLPPRSERCLR